MVLNRRQFTGALAAALASTALPTQALQAHGVQLGLQSFTFHQLRTGGVAAAEEMATAMKTLGVDLCELWAPQIEPFPLADGYWRAWLPNVEKGTPAKPSHDEIAAKRMALRAWRTSPPQGYFQQIANAFASANVRLFAFNYSFEPTMNDAEIEYGFAAAKALKVNLITASSRISDAKRLVPFAAKHGMRIAFMATRTKRIRTRSPRPRVSGPCLRSRRTTASILMLRTSLRQALMPLRFSRSSTQISQTFTCMIARQTQAPACLSARVLHRPKQCCN